MLRLWLDGQDKKDYEFAADVPVTPEQMSRWLNGRQTPGPITRRRLSDMTGLPLSDATKWASASEAAE
jgi:hypothetical protein